MTDDDDFRLGKLITEPRERRGTIFAPPILNGCIEAPKTLGARPTDSAVVINEGGNPVLCEEGRESIVIAAGNAGACVYEGDISIARPER